MTAQITNKTDSFTVYKDFRLSVPGEETVKLSKNFDDNGMNVTVKNNSSDSLTIKVLVGVYNDNDTLKTAKLQTVTLDSKAEQTISFVGITSDKSVSIFAWDKDMTPLTNVLNLLKRDNCLIILGKRPSKTVGSIKDVTVIAAMSTSVTP